MVAEFSYVMQLPSMANTRAHFWAKAKLTKKHRGIGGLLAAKVYRQLPLQPAVRRRVTLTRVGKRCLDDDNLASAFKGIRDGIAEWFRIDDGDARWEWVYAQSKGAYCIQIKLEAIS